jgi:signal peptidase I
MTDSSDDTGLPTHAGDLQRVRRARASSAKRAALMIIVEWVVIIGVAFLAAFGLRQFVVQPFYIPSASMVPTLQIGDRLLVNKLSYQLHDVRRGDIVVFEAPPGEATGDVKDLVKRVIGLPGETVQGKAGVGVFINGQQLSEPYLPDGVTARDFGPVTVPKGQMYVLGDNRMESKDSTFFGPVDESRIIGRVFVRYMPLGRFRFF